MAVNVRERFNFVEIVYLQIELSELEALRNSFERSLSLSLNDYGGMLSEEEN